MRALVVISHYNARSEDPLDMLLWQLAHIPAGMPFNVLVVVNRSDDKDVQIASKFPGVRFDYRRNTGYNIGAWDHGWRTLPDFEFYAFLQDECLIAKVDWLKSLVRSARRSLVGEAMVDPAETWEQSQASYERFYGNEGYDPARWGETGDLNTPNAVRAFMVCHGVPPLNTMRHLRALALCAPAELMKATDGFLTGNNYREAVGAEVAISQKAAAAGFLFKQAALLPFTYVIHPQWMADRCKARTLSGIARQIIPASLRMTR